MTEIEQRHARIRNLDIRLEELRWVDQQIHFPNEVEPALSERIEYYERELRKAVLEDYNA